MANSTKTSPDQVIYQEMFEAILAQRLKPGTKLKENEMAKIFKVSRTVVRRALLRLSHDSIVDIQHNRGAAVARPSIGHAHEIMQARHLIETEVVRQAIEHASDEDIESLRKLVHQEQRRFDKSNRSGGIRISGDFHIRLAEISGNTTLTNILTRLVPQTSLIIALYEKPGVPNCSHDEHFELIALIESRDTEKAVAFMSQHLSDIEKKLQPDEGEQSADLADIFSHIQA